MKTCTGTRAEAFGEDYLRGTLSEVEAQSFEEHYLTCDACFEHVRALQAARTALKDQMDMPVVAAARRSPVWAMFAFAVAAVVVLALVFHWPGHQNQPGTQSAALQTPVEQSDTSLRTTPAQTLTPETPKHIQKVELASLADRTLPPFHPTQLRGGAEDEHFEAGMQAYVGKDCKVALEAFKRVPRNSAHTDAATLYAGACNFKLRNYDSARALFTSLATSQDSPLIEAARYYLAQVELAQNDSAAAQRSLKEVVTLHGDYEERANAQLNKINAIASR